MPTRARSVLAALALAALLAVGACGDEDEPAAQDPGPTGTGTTPAPATPDSSPGTPGPEGRRDRTSRSPETDVPGGPGDEIPARGPADFTGRDGRVGPRVVRVPPFLGIGVTLRSADGREYALRIGGKTLTVGASRRTASASLEGLRPQRSYSGRATPGGTRVTIEASAEPGP